MKKAKTREALKTILAVAFFLAKLAVLMARMGLRYVYLRAKLALWIRMSQWRLKRRMKGMPPELKQELSEYYYNYAASLFENVRIHRLAGRIRGLSPRREDHD